MTNTEQKIWDIVHNWRKCQAIGMNDFENSALMGQMKELVEPETCCKEVDGFYLGTVCPKCNKPFRSVNNKPWQKQN